MPFFLDYYVNFIGVRQIFLYDGGSNDETSEIIKDYPVQMFVHKSDKLDDRQLMYFRNECYKQWRSECDWFIVCDIDEFLYHPNIHSVLARYKVEGVTLPLVEGFEMLSKKYPLFKKGEYLPTFIQTGLPNPDYYNKHLIFDPQIDINYTLGCHSAQPFGPVKKSVRAEFKNLHHKILSYEYFVTKAAQSRDRLSDWNRETGAGFHYDGHANKSHSEFLNLFIQADNVFSPVNAEIKANPLANFISQHLLSDVSDYRLIDLSNYGRYPSDVGSTFDLLKKKFGGQHIFIDHPPGRLDLAALKSVMSIQVFGNTVYLDASMIHLENLTLNEATGVMLSVLISKASNNRLLILLDLTGASEADRAAICSSSVLLSRFTLRRHDGIIIAKLNDS